MLILYFFILNCWIRLYSVSCFISCKLEFVYALLCIVYSIVYCVLCIVYYQDQLDRAPPRNLCLQTGWLPPPLVRLRNTAVFLFQCLSNLRYYPSLVRFAALIFHSAYLLFFLFQSLYAKLQFFILLFYM